MSVEVETTRKYIEQHGNPLGDGWSKFHNLRGYLAFTKRAGEALVGDFQQNETEREVRRMEAKLDMKKYRAIRADVQRELGDLQGPPIPESLRFELERAESLMYSYLRPTADLRTIVPIEGLSPQDWLAAIGDRDAETHHDAELASCCSQISAIRDVLIRAMTNEGLLPDDVYHLQALLDHHEPVVDAPVLGRIFEQLGVVWDESRMAE